MPTKSKLPAISKHTYSIMGHHCHAATKDEVNKMRESYLDSLHKDETKSCMVALDDIRYLIKYYTDSNNLGGAKPIDGFRIYFYRPDPVTMEGLPGKTIADVGDGKGQLSVIIVPTNNYREVPFGHGVKGLADDMYNKDGQCLKLIPFGGEHTGLCPTNCPK